MRARADFTYKTTSPPISMVDTGLGKFSVTEDVEAVSRKIEYRRQGSTATFKIMCRDGKGFWYGVRWDWILFRSTGKPTSEKPARNCSPFSCLSLETADPRRLAFARFQRLIESCRRSSSRIAPRIRMAAYAAKVTLPSLAHFQNAAANFLFEAAPNLSGVELWI